MTPAGTQRKAGEEAGREAEGDSQSEKEGKEAMGQCECLIITTRACALFCQEPRSAALQVPTKVPGREPNDLPWNLWVPGSTYLG